MMDEEAKRNKELCERFPFLLPYDALIESEDDDFLPKTDRVNPKFDYSYTMLDFVPKGWKDLFLRMCGEIRTEIEQTEEFRTFRIFDIKEKYGMLRMLATGGNDKTDALMDRCEKDSERVCVECGKPATRISMGWICPYCDDCIGNRQSVEIGIEGDANGNQQRGFL